MKHNYGMINIKSDDEIQIMFKANQIVHKILDDVAKNILPGNSTELLNSVAEKSLSETDATSAFKGYRRFPKVICISINDEVVHGIPSNDKIIKEDDIVSIDFGVYYQGFAGDAARTYIVGNSNSEEKINLVKRTKEGLMAGIDKMRPGNKLHDIGRAIDDIAKKYKYGNVRNFCGHGIGRKMHEDPHVFNYVCESEPNITLKKGMVFALEPMFLLGKDDVKTKDDGWTVITNDGSFAAHWELSVAITESEPLILGI